MMMSHRAMFVRKLFLFRHKETNNNNNKENKEIIPLSRTAQAAATTTSKLQGDSFSLKQTNHRPKIVSLTSCSVQVCLIEALPR